MSTLCTACSAPICFIATPAGKKLPVDAEEICVVVGAGPLKVVLDDGTVVSARETLPEDTFTPGVNVIAAWTPHWASCSDPDRYCRRKRATAS